jgi:GDP-L-fucose synthase
MRVFVAGHKGLVGSALLRTASSSVQILTAEKEDLDLTNRTKVFEFLNKESPDAVILAAAKVGGIGANSSHQFQFLLENLDIQNSVMSQSLKVGVPNFIFLGSSCVYPKYASQPIAESSLLSGSLEETNEGYAIAKIAGIRLARAISEEKNLNYFSLMPSNLYGPNDNFDLDSSHVPAALIRRFHEAMITKTKEVSIWGTGKPRREFMHVDDLANACWFFLIQKLGGQLLNIGTGVDITIKDFANMIALIVGFEGSINFDHSKPDGTPEKLLDVSKARSFGWASGISLLDGLSDTYKWYVRTIGTGQIRGLH